MFHCRQDEDEKTPSWYVLGHVRAMVCPLTTRHQLGEGKEDLEEGNITLLQESTVADFSHCLTHLHHGRASTSPAPTASSSERKVVVQSSNEYDLDNDAAAHDIANTWDDDQGDRADKDEDVEDDMDNFIEYEDEDMDGTGAMDEADREQKRREQWRVEFWRRHPCQNVLATLRPQFDRLNLQGLPPPTSIPPFLPYQPPHPVQHIRILIIRTSYPTSSDASPVRPRASSVSHTRCLIFHPLVILTKPCLAVLSYTRLLTPGVW